VFEWFIFKVSNTQPATPTGGSWDFNTETGTPPTGWTAIPPASPTTLVWLSVAIVTSTASSTITWSVPGQVAFSGPTSPITSTGDLIVGNGVNSATRLPIGSNGYVLTSNGTTATWLASTGSGANVLGTSPTITTPVISSLSSASATALTLQSAGTTAVTIDTSQNVGIGVSPSYKLHIYGSSPDIVTQHSGANGTRGYITANNNAVYFGNTYSGSNVPLVFSQAGIGSAGTERMRIDSSGNLLVGTTTSSVGTATGFRVVSDGSSNAARGELGSASTTNSNIGWSMYSTGATEYRFYVGWGGTIYATSIGITAISDQRLKENVRDIDTGLDSIMALKPRRFDWKESKGQNKKNVAGFIAQEFETVFPECVGTSLAGEDGIEYKNINHETLIPTLVKAIQELKAINDTQAETLTQQTEAINALTAEIAELKAKVG
jgi:hypothetical protein